MGYVRQCRKCRTSHQPPTGNNCRRISRVKVLKMAEALQHSTPSTETASGDIQDIVTSPGKQTAPSNPKKDDSQQVILLELQRISQTVGQFQQQAAADRAVLSDLVQRFNNTTSNQTVSTAQTSQTVNIESTARIDANRSTSLFSDTQASSGGNQGTSRAVGTSPPPGSSGR